jgi:SAM-dependent methyltransferase
VPTSTTSEAEAGVTTSSTSEAPPSSDPVKLGWPFWAPTGDDDIGRALDLADVGPTDVVADLGCGDGKVLTAAAARGARAVGYELRPEFATRARAAATPFGDRIEVREGDFFDAAIDADVVFCYLSLATVFRLRSAFERLAPGTRIVTVTYPIIGWRAEARDGACYLYRNPVPVHDGGWAAGFTAAGAVVVRPPGAELLASVVVGAAAGPLDVELTRSLRPHVRLYAGDPSPDSNALVPIDISARAPTEGRVVRGGLRVQGHEFRIILVGRSGRSGFHRLAADELQRAWSDAGIALQAHTAVDRLVETVS